jgi:hypothetical protein
MSSAGSTIEHNGRNIARQIALALPIIGTVDSLLRGVLGSNESKQSEFMSPNRGNSVYEH